MARTAVHILWEPFHARARVCDSRRAPVSLTISLHKCLPMIQMRDAVKSVARLFPTAIISGRGREKVESFVQLRELYYAGSHGMDIIGPRVRSS